MITGGGQLTSSRYSGPNGVKRWFRDKAILLLIMKPTSIRCRQKTNWQYGFSIILGRNAADLATARTYTISTSSCVPQEDPQGFAQAVVDADNFS